MGNFYNDVNCLIREDAKAKELYMAQPDYILGEMALHSDSIHTFEQLKSYICSKQVDR